MAGTLGAAILALVLGLLLGSVLPADIFARRRGVDIRAEGDGNPGTVNAVRVLGWAPGLVTAIYDLSVGIAAIQIARLLGTSEAVGYAAGLMAVVGHRFPVFRGLRGGGQGMAASAGLLVYGVGVAMYRGWLTPTGMALALAVLAAAFVFTRSDSVAAVVMLPVLLATLTLSRPGLPYAVFMWVVVLHIWFVQVGAARRWLASRPVREVRHRTQG